MAKVFPLPKAHPNELGEIEALDEWLNNYCLFFAQPNLRMLLMDNLLIHLFNHGFIHKDKDIS